MVYNLNRNYFIIVSFCIWHRLSNKWCSVITQPGKNAKRGGSRRKRANVPTFQNGPSVERKYADYTNTLQTLTDTGTAILLNGTTQGTGSSNADRIGTKITVKSVKVTLTAGAQVADLVAGTGYQNDADTIRAVIVFDKQTNGAAASWASLMNASGTYSAPYAKRNIATLDRYMMLADKTFEICSSGPNSIVWNFDIPCNLETRYTTTNNGDVTDIITGSIYLIVVDSNNTGNLPGTFSMLSRIEFTDQ